MSSFGGIGVKLSEQLAERGRALAARETTVAEPVARARSCSQDLHALVAEALEAFHAACNAGGAGHLRVELSAPRIDDKHVHSVQFDLRRGAHRAIVTVKSKGEVTLVGPFRVGKVEGPCNRFSIDDRPDIEAGLATLLGEFVDQAFGA